MLIPVKQFIKRHPSSQIRHFTFLDAFHQGKYGVERKLPHMTAKSYERNKVPKMLSEAALEDEDERFDLMIQELMGRTAKTDPTSVAAPMPEG